MTNFIHLRMNELPVYLEIIRKCLKLICLIETIHTFRFVTNSHWFYTKCYIYVFETFESELKCIDSVLFFLLFSGFVLIKFQHRTYKCIYNLHFWAKIYFGSQLNYVTMIHNTNEQSFDLNSKIVLDERPLAFQSHQKYDE